MWQGARVAVASRTACHARSFSNATAPLVDWLFPVTVHFGAGRAAELPTILAGLSSKRPLVVTDRGLAQTAVVSGILDTLRGASLEPLLFSDVPPNPTDVSIGAGAAAFQSHGADCVIALGGGSGLDAGKSIAMVARSGLTLEQVEWTLEPTPVEPGLIPPVITMPTTSGTGAEMDAASMYTDTVRRVKRCVTHPNCSVTVVADPLLTISLPPKLTAWTGLDALTHALEAFSVDMFHPMCDAIALEAMRLINDWLLIAFRDGSNIHARAQMMTASSMAAVAFQKGLGAVHGLSEPIGAVFDTQHGLTNAVILPYVLRANQSKIEDKCELIARYLDLPRPSASIGMPHSGFDAVIAWVDTLLDLLEIPQTLADIGVDASMAAELATKAHGNATGFSNPLKFTVADYEVVYRDACAGALVR